MKKFYPLLMVLFMASGSYAQCVIDTANLSNPAGGVYPSATHLPHIVRDSTYDQTVQGRIPDTMSISIGGFINVSIQVDSVRLDSINGLPAGINWARNPNVLKGGGFGCVEFTGSTSDTAGTYPMSPIGMIWARLNVPPLINNVDTFMYGPLDRLPMFRNYFLVVDSVQMPLSVTGVVTQLCNSTPTGSINVHAAGGSPTSPYTYVWNTGATSYFINNLDTGTYSLTVTSGAETVTSSFVVTMDAPIVTTTTSDSSTNGTNGSAVVMATGGTPPYTYFWQGTGGGNTDSVGGLAPGTYRVTVRDSVGCIARDSAVVPGIIPSGILAIANVVPQLRLSPNPASNSMNVTIESAGVFSGKMQAMDMNGRVVYSAPVAVSAGSYSRSLNLEHFAVGTYILQITSQNQSIQQRFVVNH
jgi:hypothetical protein